MNQSVEVSDLYGKQLKTHHSLTFGGLNNNDTGSQLGTNLPEYPAAQNNNNTFNTNRILLIFNSFAIVLCLVTCIVHIQILLVLRRCRKIPTSLRLLSTNFLSNSLLLYVFIMLTSIMFVIWTDANTQSFIYARMICVAGIYASQVGATGGLALERYVRIIYPLQAMRMLKQRNIIVYIVITWITGFITSITLTLQGLVQCEFILQKCDLSHAAHINRIVVVCIVSCFTTLICFSYVRISKAIKSLQHVNDNQVQYITPKIDSTTTNVSEKRNSPPYRNTRNIFRATGYILKINITFLICHVPVLINAMIFVVFPKLETTQLAVFLQFVSFTCSVISFYVSSHFFIWKFKECKLVFMQMFCSWNKGLDDVIRELKMEVYDIPTAVRVTSPGKVHPKR